MLVFVNFLSILFVFMLFLKSKRVFALVLQTESRHFHVHEGKANAHAGMPFSAYLGLLYRLLAGLWSYDQRATALLGRGSFVFIV